MIFDSDLETSLKQTIGASPNPVLGAHLRDKFYRTDFCILPESMNLHTLALWRVYRNALPSDGKLGTHRDISGGVQGLR
ncbi:hypothetical protein LEP1GSC050_2542 [Leptospira broomii serovar Hurstbridge str. 5399]|uniref:Uncharacterized protein n=1 Tax=Leptospira broomii serovar Hurstbridge str. 5399 TaxID=1049789 RepID=T0EYG6_9LEPT|nr:hypothetical protein LEP1GSC050_2542 [Leptospira broomii serovar Hurstbridge str. 5399]